MKTEGFVTLTQEDNSDLLGFSITFPIENFGFVEKGANGQALVTLAKPHKQFWVQESHDKVVKLVAQASKKSSMHARRTTRFE